MIQTKPNWPFRIGIFLFALIWLIFTFSEFTLDIFNRHTGALIVIEDLPQVWGLGLRAAAGVIAVITILFYIVKRDLSKSEALMAARFVLILEAAYFLSFFPAGFVGISYQIRSMSQFARVFEQILPCFVESILVTAVLAKLFFELNPAKPATGAIKWGLISGTAYLLVFWLNNAGIWIGTIITKGINYIALYPLNLFSFIITTIGLFLLILYTANFSKKSFGTEILTKLNLNLIGIIITLVGLYLNGILLMYLYFGSVGGWSTWYSWFLGHGYVGMWFLSLPLVSVPLLFIGASNNEGGSRKGRLLHLKRKQLDSFMFLVQGVGVILFSILALAYILPLPTTKVYIGSPIFQPLLTIFGSIFFVLSVLGLVLPLIAKIDD